MKYIRFIYIYYFIIFFFEKQVFRKCCTRSLGFLSFGRFGPTPGTHVCSRRPYILLPRLFFEATPRPSTQFEGPGTRFEVPLLPGTIPRFRGVPPKRNEWPLMEKPPQPWPVVSLKGTMGTMGRDPQINENVFLGDPRGHRSGS